MPLTAHLIFDIYECLHIPDLIGYSDRAMLAKLVAIQTQPKVDQTYTPTVWYLLFALERNDIS